MPSITAEPPVIPSSGELLNSIRSSCTSVAEAACIQVDETAFQQLVSDWESEGSVRASSKDYSLALPLRFDSVGAEVNIVSLICALSILSPTQALLDQLPGASSSTPPTSTTLVRQLILGLYLSAPPANHLDASSPLSAAHLAAMGEGEVAELLGLKIHVEKQVEHIPIAMLAERGGPGSAIVVRLTKAMNTLGQRLVDNRYVDLGAFVLETLGQCKGKGKEREEEAIGHFVQRLVNFLPDLFRDAYTVATSSRGGGEAPLHLYKNAQLLLAALFFRFLSDQDGGRDSSLPWLPSDGSAFSMLADADVVDELLRRKVLVSSGTGEGQSAGLRAALSNSDSRDGSNASQALSADDFNVLRAACVAMSGSSSSSSSSSQSTGSKSWSWLDLDATLRRSSAATSSAPRIHVREEDIEIAGPW